MRLAIIGAGTMGQGIAQISAQAGFETVLYDINPEGLAKAQASIESTLEKLVAKGKLTSETAANTTAKLSYTSNIQSVKADLVVEAIVEKLEVKRALYKSLEAQLGASVVLASNTSSLSITQIAAGLDHPERVIGLHFFNPAPLMPLVEVVKGVASADWALDRGEAFAVAVGKQVVSCTDSPGFIVNRVARPFYTESLLLIEQGVCSTESLDKLIVASGFKMGPFVLMDMIGNDVNFSVTSSLYEACYQVSRFRPSRIQQQKVDAGHLGRKSGRGFYSY